MYTIDVRGAGHRYATEVPMGWRILGTIHSENDALTGALGRSPAGLYAMFNAGTVRPLDQSAVAVALGVRSVTRNLSKRRRIDQRR